MTVEKAIRRIKEEYSKAKKLGYIQKPLAWVLYQVWREADREGK